LRVGKNRVSSWSNMSKAWHLPKTLK